MNFFKLYIGDYQRDTGTLTLAEHGAYLLMLQHYYATERPLPVGRDLHRLLRAETKAERDAIDAVANRFWTATSDGLVNVRANEEIQKGRAQAEVNRSIAVQREAKKRATNNERTEHESCSTREPNHSHSHIKTSVAKATGASPPDPVKAIFDLGVSVLVGAGGTDKGARSLVGRLRSAVGDDEAMAVLVAAKSKTDPQAYIAAAMRVDPVAEEISRQMGGAKVEKVGDGTYRCSGRYFNADGKRRVALC